MPKTGSTQAALARDVERLELVLRWLAGKMLPTPDMPCRACGHDIGDHLDGADESTLCLWPVGHGAPVSLCRCIAYR